MRVLTLNLQHCLPNASAGELHTADICRPEQARAVLEALAAQIAEIDPDVVALQEVDLRQKRSGGIDQAGVLADLLRMPYWRFAATYAGSVAGLRRRPRATGLSSPTDDYLGPFLSALGQEPCGYGNALLSRLPVRQWRVQRLGRGPHSVQARKDAPLGFRVWTASQRLLLGATLDTTLGDVNLGVTHLATRQDTARKQLSQAWWSLSSLPGTPLLVGDFNLNSSELQRLAVGRELGEGNTYPALAPQQRIDHLLSAPLPTDATGAVAAGSVLRADDWGTRTFLVSDHAGTWGDLSLMGD